VLVNAGGLGFEHAEQDFLDAAGAGGLELLSDSGLQGCVADFDGHDWLLGCRVRERVGASTKSPEELMRSGGPLLAKEGSSGARGFDAVMLDRRRNETQAISGLFHAPGCLESISQLPDRSLHRSDRLRPA